MTTKILPIIDWIQERYSKPLNIIVRSKPKYSYKGYRCELLSSGQDREVVIKVKIGPDMGRVLNVDESEIRIEN